MIWWWSGCIFVTQADIEKRHADPVPTADPNDLDLDGDGVVGRLDCNDDDPRVFPGQQEVPNQIDDDCDGLIDNGTIFYDDDGDGFCEQNPCAAACGLDDCSGDCDDEHAVVYPGAPELCDGLSNDCNWEGDEFDDRDGDGWSIAQGDPDDRDVANQPTSVTMVMASLSCRVVRVEPGTSTQGCDEAWCSFEESPEHSVTVTYPFLMMEVEVTRGPWNRILGPKNWAFPTCGDTCPVTRVAWDEVFDLTDQLNQFYDLPLCGPDDDPLACEGWRLPTEAEWAWAARGMSSERFAGGTNASLVGWIADNSSLSVHPTRLKTPNERGIYDLTGNVWEWTWDVEQPYPFSAVTDPVFLDPDEPDQRRQRGASARTPLELSHLTTRSSGDRYAIGYVDTGEDSIDHSPNNPYNYHGFRLVRRAP